MKKDSKNNRDLLREQPLPEKFCETIKTLYGQKGSSWLDALPHFLVSISHRYGLEDLTLFENLSYNLVLKA